MDLYNGILPVRKTAGMTSHDLIRRLRHIMGQKKIGHTGTLDPQATGLMLICLGRATKLTQFLTDWDKAYLAELTLGMTSDTQDGAGTLTAGGPVPDISAVEFSTVLGGFCGKKMQKVPAYSAVKVSGRELHKYARAGIEVESPTREIEIKSIALTAFSLPRVSIRVECSKGTYIRVVAHDIGQALGCGAYLSQLERLRVGPYTLDIALTEDDVARRHEDKSLEAAVVGIEKVLQFPIISMGDRVTAKIKDGVTPIYRDVLSFQGDFHSGDLVSMADDKGRIVAIGRSKCDARDLQANPIDDFFSYVRVLV
jgi:tRNA pseudouridine55 synthase